MNVKHIITTLKRWILAGLISLLPVIAVAQIADSLEDALQQQSLSKEDKLKAYDELSWNYLSTDAHKSINYGKQGLELAINLKDETMEAVFLRNIGVGYYMWGKYDTAATYLHRALKTVAETDSTVLEGRIYNAFGNLYNQQSDYARALENYLKSLQILEAAGNQPLEGLYNNIAVLYQNLRNKEQAILYFTKARQEAEKNGNVWTLGSVAMAMSNYYMDDDPDKALAYANEALEHFKTVGDTYNEILSTLTIGHCHRRAGDYDLALGYARQGVALAQNSSFPKLVAEAEADLSSIHYERGEYAESILHAQRSLDKDSTDFDLAGNMLANMLRSYFYLQKPDSANFFLNRYQDWIESHSNENFQKTLSEMEVKYETQKKSMLIASLKKQRQLYTWLGIAGAVLLLTALAFFIARHRLAESKRKLAEQQTRQLQQEKQLVSVQAALDGESAERSRLAKDLHDGLGSMLSVVKFNLPEVKSGAILEEGDVLRFHSALNMLDNSIKELRRVAHHMMPESLLRYGLQASLSDFCNAIPGVQFHSYGNQERLPQQLETLIYRCVHELVNNALKHAHATAISVQLIQEADRVSFTVQDDGVGFDVGSEKEGMGLKNIEQRIEAFKGKLSVYSSAGKGTEIHAEFNLNSKNAST